MRLPSLSLGPMLVVYVSSMQPFTCWHLVPVCTVTTSVITSLVQIEKQQCVYLCYNDIELRGSCDNLSLRHTTDHHQRLAVSAKTYKVKSFPVASIYRYTTCRERPFLQFAMTGFSFCSRSGSIPLIFHGTL